MMIFVASWVVRIDLLFGGGLWDGRLIEIVGSSSSGKNASKNVSGFTPT